jgi:hypothetical protein
MTTEVGEASGYHYCVALVSDHPWQVSNYRHRHQRTSADVDGWCDAGQTE